MLPPILPIGRTSNWHLSIPDNAAAVSFPSQTGWGYRLWASTNLLNNWQAAGSIVDTVTGNGSLLQIVHTNGAVSPQRYWRLEIKEGGF